MCLHCIVVYADVACISLYDCMCGGSQEARGMQLFLLKVDPKKHTDTLGLLLLSQRNELIVGAVGDVCQ